MKRRHVLSRANVSKLKKALAGFQPLIEEGYVAEKVCQNNPKYLGRQRFSLLIYKRDLLILRIVEKHTGCTVSEQIRRALDVHCEALVRSAEKKWRAKKGKR